MPDTFMSALREWQGFYQVTGESSATLTGLMFISITLIARLITKDNLRLVRTFISPVLGYFLMSLVISALMCIPTQTRPWLTGELAAIGLIGLSRSVSLMHLMFRHKDRLRLEQRHWLWHLALPSLGSLSLLAAAIGLWWRWPPALDVLAFAVLLLVVTGVVNAWEMALQTVQAVPEDIPALNPPD